MEKWKFQGNQGLKSLAVSVSGAFNVLMQSISKEKEVVHLCRVDPTDNPLFSVDPVAAHAVSTAVHSGNFNCYPPTFGLPQARRAIGEYLSRDLPNKLSAEDIYVTDGATQAIDIIQYLQLQGLTFSFQDQAILNMKLVLLCAALKSATLISCLTVLGR
ncbi:probable aminotransferase TAT2 [Arachis hypogaea]|uniref:probable aminotransferase TAT2 n=1 Tax=Arachis hypogaea TaxID=3818 RepID=UPI003B226CEE